MNWVSVKLYQQAEAHVTSITAPTRHGRYDPLSVLAYIDSYQRSHTRCSPSQREITASLRISAPSVVHNMLHRLQRDGLVAITTYGPGKNADLEIAEIGHEHLRRWRASQAKTSVGSSGGSPTIT